MFIIRIIILLFCSIGILYMNIQVNAQQRAFVADEYGQLMMNDERARLDGVIVNFSNNPGAKMYIFAGALSKVTCQSVGKGRNRRQVCTDVGKNNAQRRINFAVGYMVGGVPRSQRRHNNFPDEDPDVEKRAIPKNFVFTEAGVCTEEFTRIYIVPRGALSPTFSCQ